MAGNCFRGDVSMQIRPHRPGDGAAMSALYERSVRAIGPRNYTAAQVEAWASLRPSPERLDALCADGRLMLIAADAADQPIGFIDLERDGHIHLLYCAPEAVGTGVAGALYQALEQAARDWGLTRLYTEASEASRRFFLKQGFTLGARRDLRIGEVQIHNYAMEKALTANGTR
jgi:putative acetyltransferase